MNNYLTKRLKASILLIAALSMASVVFAQDNDDNMPETRVPSASESTVKVFYPLSLEAAGELCYPLTNFALRDNFGGVYSWHASVQAQLFKHFEGGVEFQNQQFATASSVEALAVSAVHTDEFLYNLGVKVSYYSEESSQWFFSPSFVVGQSWIVFNRVPNAIKPPGGFNKQAFFITPRICESLKVDDALRIGAEIDYTFVNYAFSPTWLGFNTKTYTSDQTIRPTTFLSWGFYVVYFLGKPKS